MSDGGGCFQFASINENPKARTIIFYVKPTKRRWTGLVHNTHKEREPFSNLNEQSTPNSRGSKGTNVLLGSGAASITYEFSKLFNVFLCYQGNTIAALLGDTLNSHDQNLSFCFAYCAICSFLPELHSGK